MQGAFSFAGMGTQLRYVWRQRGNVYIFTMITSQMSGMTQQLFKNACK
jgi:hypothetical protein